jgi:hypothetical protein
VSTLRGDLQGPCFGAVCITFGNRLRTGQDIIFRMCQQKLKNNISEPRIFAPPNWRPLERWLPPSLREEFVWMWRQGIYEYYRYTHTGEYLVLDQFGQCCRESDLGLIPADFPMQYKHVTGTTYRMPSAGPIELRPVTSLRNVVRDTDDSVDEQTGEENEDEDDLDESLLEIVKNVARPRIGQLWRLEDQIALEHKIQIFSALFLCELGINFRKVVQWLG